MNTTLRRLLVPTLLLSISALQNIVVAQPPQEPTPNKQLLSQEKKALINDVDESTSVAGRDEKFQKLMTGAKLTGLFTIEGKPMKDQVQDTYEIRKVEKAKTGEDMWVITARVKYGKNDYEMPFPIAVKWAGDTPVLTLEKLAVPGLGTFSCRVVLHGTKYAGTWQHDNVGGHMFGNIILAGESKPESTDKPTENATDKPTEKPTEKSTDKPTAKPTANANEKSEEKP